MKITRRNPQILLALGLASVLLSPASLRAAPGGTPGGMQVEEPDLGGPKPPIQPERDQEAWMSKGRIGLTAEQQASLKARQETMKDMMVLIQKKRLAIRDARPEQRVALAQELHNLILEKSQVVRGRGRVEERKDSSRDIAHLGQDDASGPDVNLRVHEARGKAEDQKARRQEARRQVLEERMRILDEKPRATFPDHNRPRVPLR